MLDWSQCPVVERQPDKVSGAWLFKGTRVPVKALFENIEAGARIDDFLEWFPGVSRDQVEAVLQHAELSLAEAFDVFVTTDRSRRRRDLRRNGSCASIVSTGCPASAYTWATSNDQK
jgi:uncharacterized protein (DUF433 family)